MPYIRLYLPKDSVEHRRSIAQKFIEITLRAFRLRAQDRYRVSIEFVSTPPSRSTNYLSALSENQDYTVEVMGHGLTEETKRAFSDEAAAVLNETLGLKSRIARLFGIEIRKPSKIAFRFGELNPAVSEPYVIHSGRIAA